MTEDAISEGRRLLGALRAGQRDPDHLLIALDRQITTFLDEFAALLTATGAAEARVTALEQERDKAVQRETYFVEQLDEMQARALAAEARSQQWKAERDGFEQVADSERAEVVALQAQLTAAEARVREAEEQRRSDGEQFTQQFHQHAFELLQLQAERDALAAQLARERAWFDRVTAEVAARLLEMDPSSTWRPCASRPEDVR